MAWITPRASAVTRRDVLLSIPDTPDARAILRGLLYQLTDPAEWEQVTGTIAPQTAADEWQDTLQDYLDYRGCP